MTKQQAIEYFEERLLVMECPPIHIGTAVAVEEWARSVVTMRNAFALAAVALRDQVAREANDDGE